MKIAILGYSGSGKSTLARELAELYGIDVFHFDSIHFLPGWVVRPREEKVRLTEEFLDTHTSWVMDGNYSKLFYDRRMEEADEIILLLFSRFSCLKRAFCRYLKYRNKTRPDMAEGCREKFDFEFAKWILWEGRTKRARDRYKYIAAKYSEKAVVIKNQRQLDRYLEKITENTKKL